MIYGARTSLAAAFSVVILIFVLGTVLGILAGYFGGWADAVIMRIADLMVSFPGMVFAMAIAGCPGGKHQKCGDRSSLGKLDKICQTCPEPGAEDPESGLCGSRRGHRFQDLSILRRYMIPNVYPHFGHYRRHRYRRYDAGTAGLSFLGFGAKAPTPEWGLMLNEGRQYIQNASWMMIFPGAAILL